MEINSESGGSLHQDNLSVDNTQNSEEVLPEQEVSEEKNESPHKKKNRIEKPVRPFPQFSIKDAMQIPQIIGQQNAGNPWAPEHVASALNTSKATNSFFYLTSASRDYGFTTGTSRAKSIELTALGRKVAFPESSIDESQAVREAFNNIEVFKDVYTYYQGGSLPEDKYFCNTLRENFGIDSSYHQDFLSIFKNNLEIIGQGNTLSLSPASPPVTLCHLESHEESSVQPTSGELFVIMPFSEKTGEYPKGYFDEVYNSLLVPAAAEAGLTAKTAKRSGSDIIHSTIVSDIFNAQIVLADLTEHNPNVLFELGLAIAFKKKVVLIRAKGTSAIFDVDNLMRVYDYDRNLWKSTIERDVPNLSKHIQGTLQTEGSMYLDILLKK